jgi:hypothetical protein
MLVGGVSKILACSLCGRQNAMFWVRSVEAGKPPPVDQQADAGRKWDEYDQNHRYLCMVYRLSNIGEPADLIWTSQCQVEHECEMIKGQCG